MTITLIIPAYNEENRLPKLLRELAIFLRSNPFLFREILIVDDGSQDSTAAVTESFKNQIPQLKLLRQPQNLGKGAAVKRGIGEAQSDAVIFMDADGATSPFELPKLINALREAPIVVGDRWAKASEVRGQTTLRSISSRTIRIYMSIFGLGDIDTMCGFKGFRRNIALKIFNPLFESRWLFDQEVLFRARLLGYPIRSIPIRWTSQHGSKVKFTTLVISAFRLPILLFHVCWETRKKQH